MKLNMFCLIILAISSVSVSGQGYYDDDIYYDASKTKKQEKAKTAVVEKPIEIEESGYQVYDNDPRDVDEYNRRNLFSGQDTIVVSGTGENANVFAYTERLERFDNPEIVKGSDDEELKDLYYANDVDIYIGTPSPYVSISVFDPWYSPWVSWTWGYPYGYWNAWYDPYYYGWHRPYYWGWGWSYPYHHHPWHYYPHYPHHGYAWNGHPRRSDTGRRAFGGNKGNTVVGGGRSSFSGNRNASRRASSSYSTGTRPSQERTYNGYRGSSSQQESGTYRNNSTNRQPTNQTPSYNNNTERRSSTGRTPSYNNSKPSSRNSGISSGRSGSSGGRGSFGGGRSSGGRRR